VPQSKNASSVRKGKAVEHLVAAVCALVTAGELTALTALVDDEGVDVGFKRRNGPRALDIQVKALPGQRWCARLDEPLPDPLCLGWDWGMGLVPASSARTGPKACRARHGAAPGLAMSSRVG
jgi:hypothetical protein